MIDEKWLAAVCHGSLYQSQMALAFDKKVRAQEFQPRDIILKKVLLNQSDLRGKWTPAYKGPYVVKKSFSRGALILTHMDGKALPNPVNSDAVKRYYS